MGPDPKITTDINKFCNPLKGAAEMFDGYRIKRWILAVPTHDSRDVVQHALKKTAEIIQKKLAYVDPSFQILVHDKDDFDEASWDKRIQLRKRIKPLIPVPTEAEVAEMAVQNQNLVDNLRDKLGVRLDNDGDLDDAIDEALRGFLESQNAVSQLRNLAPDAYEEITLQLAQRLRRLRMGSGGGRKSGSP